jgi:hypothetical protein
MEFCLNQTCICSMEVACVFWSYSDILPVKCSVSTLCELHVMELGWMYQGNGLYDPEIFKIAQSSLFSLRIFVPLIRHRMPVFMGMLPFVFEKFQ